MQILQTKNPLGPNLEVLKTIRFKNNYPSVYWGHLVYKRIISPTYRYPYPNNDDLDRQLLSEINKYFNTGLFVHNDLLMLDTQEPTILHQIRGGFDVDIPIYFVPTPDETEYHNKPLPGFALRLIIQSDDTSIKNFLPSLFCIYGIPMNQTKMYIDSIVRV